MELRSCNITSNLHLSHLGPCHPALQVHFPVTWWHEESCKQSQLLLQPWPYQPLGHPVDNRQNTQLLAWAIHHWLNIFHRLPVWSCLPACLPAFSCVSVYLYLHICHLSSTCLPANLCLSVYLPIYVPVDLPACQSVCLPTYHPTHQPVHPSVCLKPAHHLW